MNPDEFAALTAAPNIEWHVVTVDRFGPLIRCGCVVAQNLEIHIHLNLGGTAAVAGNVREKTTGRGTHVHGDAALQPPLLASLMEKLRKHGIQEYHQALRAVGWTVGCGTDIPQPLMTGLGARFQAFGAVLGENVDEYDPRYNWKLT